MVYSYKGPANDTEIKGATSSTWNPSTAMCSRHELPSPKATAYISEFARPSSAMRQYWASCFPSLKREWFSMIPSAPTANVLNPLLWLGCYVNGKVASTGSGVIINVGGAEYLATALHVIENTG